jgi:hypothetical protein
MVMVIASLLLEENQRLRGCQGKLTGIRQLAAESGVPLGGARDTLT